MSMGTIIVILLVLAVLGVLPTWGYSSGYGWGPSGVLGFVLLILVVLMLLGKFRL